MRGALHPHILFHLTVLLSLLPFSTPVQLSTPTNAQAMTKILYNTNLNTSANPITLNAMTIYSITFAKNYNSTPVIAYSINHYKMNDQFYYENFLSKVGTKNNLQFTLNVTVSSSTTITKFSINYLAIANEVNFLTIDKSYSMASNISSGLTSNRSFTSIQSYNFTSTSVSYVPLIRGYYIQSSIGYLYQWNVTVINITSYKVQIYTAYDCYLMRADLTILFYYITILQTKNYLFTMNSNTYSSSNINTSSFIMTVTSTNVSIYILGFHNFGSNNTASSQLNLGWTIDSSINGVDTITFLKGNLNLINYTLFQISYDISSNSTANNTNNSTTNNTTTNNTTTNNTTTNNTTTNNTTTDSSPTTESSGAIIGVAIGVATTIAIIAISAVVYFKFFKKVYIKDMPSKDELREMPSIQF